ncbi:SERTA domain-containing protein 2-like [Halichoeres trimaculatus]|uniref:SERTA domain-containing protein 2-like n=1 Tax=Halichoeres trimaculatus TaxID=147232 RepID=UPI003D9F6DDD
MRFMLGSSVKRKLSEDEDGLEADLRPLAAGAVSQAAFTLQRQTVLNMSVMKLYSPRLGADPRLQRRVLINNIIRRIHAELQQEGGQGALFSSAAPPLSAVREPRQAPPPLPSFIFSSPLSGLTALDSCLTPASLLEEDMPMFFTLPSSSSQHIHLHHSPRPPPPPPPPPELLAPPKDSFTSALEEITELCPFSLTSRPPSLPPRVMFDVIMKEEVEEGRGLQEVEERSEKPPPPSSSFLTDFALDDSLFTDIDSSMYDLGPCPPPSGAPPTKMVPVLMSGYGAAGGGAQNPPFKMDLTELDHIVEVSVGS